MGNQGTPFTSSLLITVIETKIDPNDDQAIAGVVYGVGRTLIENNGGFLKWADVGRIWPQYDRSLWPTLVRLLSRVELMLVGLSSGGRFALWTNLQSK